METRKLSIFALDDNPDDLVILSHKLAKLSDWEIEFHAFQSWKTAEKKLKSLTLDVIFIDYFLGLESGIDVIKEIRLRGDERPVIMLTGKGTEKVAAEVTRAGADDYLIKGEVTSDLLRVTISKVIEVYKSRCDNSLLKQQLKQSQKMETLGTLAGGIAHDFNNMLTAVMGYIELGVINIHEEEAKQDLEIAIQVCQQMADIVQNLLNFSRKEMSDRKSIGFNKIITLTENILRHILPKSINLAVSLPDPSYVIFGSETELQQVVLNLITNASEAMNGSGIIEIDCNEISIDTKQLNNHPMLLPGDYVCLEIRDQGSGMEESTIERIFEPFFTTKPVGVGTGLGLSVSYFIITENHHGKMSVESGTGKGAKFLISL
ncbi:response regulator, partial [bacterium]|nr:response regulator [bacterium]